jgi:hypothetical protein
VVRKIRCKSGIIKLLGMKSEEEAEQSSGAITVVTCNPSMKSLLLMGNILGGGQRNGGIRHLQAVRVLAPMVVGGSGLQKGGDHLPVVELLIVLGSWDHAVETNVEQIRIQARKCWVGSTMRDGNASKCGASGTSLIVSIGYINTRRE